MRPETWIVLSIMVAALPVGVGGAVLLNWRDSIRARRVAEEDRITQPLPRMRDDLSEEWPTRQTPTDLAAAYEPLPLPHLPTRSPRYLPRRRVVATVGPAIVDRDGCSVPCLARHCALHGPAGTEAQRGGWAFTEAVRRALFTPTAEWDTRQLGYHVPDTVPDGVELLHIGMRELVETAT